MSRRCRGNGVGLAEPATLPDLLRRASAADAERVAVEVEAGEALTYGSWEDRSTAQAHGLKRAGVRRGERVALRFDAARFTEYAVTYLAAHKVAAVAVPLGAGLTGPELGRILGDCQASAVVAPGLAARDAPVPILDPGELEDGGSEPLPAASVRGCTAAEILYQSRPLRPPLPIPRSHRALLAGPSLAFDPAAGSPSLLHSFPVGTVAGQDALCASLAPTPVRSVVLPAFDPDRFCALLSAGPIGACALHPSTAQALLDSGAGARHDLSHVSGLVLAGGRISPALLLSLTAAFPRAALLLIDVLGRPPSVRTVLTHDRGRRGSLGRPSEGTAVRVTDDAGEPVGSGEVGRVWARASGAEGEVATGDLGYIDEDGFLYVVGGRHDAARRGRPAVSKAEVEGDRERIRTPAAVVETVAAVWQRVLGRLEVEPTDDFFELGGDPFTATTVLSLLEDAFEVRVPLSAFLASPTVAGVARAVEDLRAGEGAAAPPTVAFSQEGMLWHECFAPGSQSLPGLARRFRGPLDVGALGRALDEIVRRQGALRTTFALGDGRPVQVVAPHRPLELPVGDLSDLAPLEREAEVERLVAEAGGQPFDLVAGPLFQPTLLRLAGDDHVLVIRTHHAVFDDWSVGVFRRELAALYSAYVAGGASPLPEPALQFADFSRRQRGRLAGRAGARQLSFWRRELAGAPFTTQLPVDDPDLPEGGPQSAGEPVSLVLPAELRDGLRALARRERATLYMTMLTAFGVLVHRYTGQEDLLLATVVANRNRTELEGLIGCFTKKVPLRLRLSGDPTFSEALSGTRTALLGALSNQDLPFEGVVQDVLGGPAASHGLAPHVVLMFQGVTPRQELTLPGVETAGFETSGSARRAHFMAAAAGDGSAGAVPELAWGSGLYLGTFVILSLIESEEELSLVVRGAFHGPAVSELMKSFRALLADIAADPARRVSELEILDRQGRAEVLGRGRGQAKPLPADTLPRAFAAQVQKAPHAPAVRARADALSYADLDARSDQLADRLRALGAAPGARVGIARGPSPELVVAVLAVWKAGAAWVGLDPAEAEDRLAWIVRDASLEIVVGDAGGPALPGHVRVVMPDGDGDGRRGSPTAPSPVAGGTDDPALVFYGSGSSALGHGVVLDHRAVLNLLTGLSHGVHRPPGTASRRLRVCLSAPPTDDGFLRQLVAVLDGHCLHVPDRALDADPREAVSLLGAGQVDLLDCSPDELEALLDVGLREALAQGERGEAEPVLVVGTRAAAGPELWRTLRGLQGVRAHVLYGPPECAFGATIRAAAQAPAPRGVGRPMAGVESHVLDSRGRPVPVRAAGELQLGGISLARGYLNHPEAGGERFVERALEGAGTRLHRTGQLARSLPDGGVELLGPSGGDGDLRGFRIEPQRIRSALAGCPGVRDVAVALEPDDRGHRRVVAHVVPDGEPPTLDRLRAFLWSSLPGYAWPCSLLVDPPPRAEGHGDAATATGLRTEICPEQSVLGALWGEVLGLERVPPGANYWQAFSFLEALAGAREAGVAVPGEHVTANRTIETLAAALAATRQRPRA